LGRTINEIVGDTTIPSTCRKWAIGLVGAFHDGLQILSITVSLRRELPFRRTGIRQPKKRQTNAGDARSSEEMQKKGLGLD
jgi:hypothetical protein